MEENIVKGNKEKSDMEALIAKKTEEKNTLFAQLQQAKMGMNIYEEQLNKLSAKKADLEKQLDVTKCIFS